MAAERVVDLPRLPLDKGASAFFAPLKGALTKVCAPELGASGGGGGNIILAGSSAFVRALQLAHDYNLPFCFSADVAGVLVQQAVEQYRRTNPHKWAASAAAVDDDDATMGKDDVTVYVGTLATEQELQLVVGARSELRKLSPTAQIAAGAAKYPLLPAEPVYRRQTAARTGGGISGGIPRVLTKGSLGEWQAIIEYVQTLPAVLDTWAAQLTATLSRVCCEPADSEFWLGMFSPLSASGWIFDFFLLDEHGRRIAGPPAASAAAGMSQVTSVPVCLDDCAGFVLVTGIGAARQNLDNSIEPLPVWLLGPARSSGSTKPAQTHAWYPQRRSAATTTATATATGYMYGRRRARGGSNGVVGGHRYQSHGMNFVPFTDSLFTHQFVKRPPPPSRAEEGYDT